MELKYQGNRLFCNECNHCPKSEIINGETKYSLCPNLDHNKVRLYTKIFGGYDQSLRGCNICRYYEPALWNVSSQREYKGVEAYIEYLEKEYYDLYDIRNSTVGSITICIGGYDCYGEIHYNISLYDWVSGSWFKDNKIKYLRKYKVTRTKGGRPTKTEFISKDGVDDLSKYVQYGVCDYLL